MRRAGRVLAGAAGWLLAVCGGIIFLGSAGTLHRGSATFGADLFAVGFYAATTLAGIALIRFAWPGQLARIGRGVVALFTSLAAFSNPIVHGLAIYLVAVPLLAVTGEASILVAAAFALLYAIASPALIALRPRPWLTVPLSMLVGVTLVAALPATAEALAHRRFGDDWMVMLGPVMLYPAALVAALAFRIVWKRRAAAPAPVGATPHVAQQNTLR